MLSFLIVFGNGKSGVQSLGNLVRLYGGECDLVNNICICTTINEFDLVFFFLKIVGIAVSLIKYLICSK